MQSEDAEINDLIVQLKKLEMPYTEGAWEDFEHFREQEKGKKRRILFYYRLAASFLILVGFGLLAIFLNPFDTTKKADLVSKNLLKNRLENKSKNQDSEKVLSLHKDLKIKETKGNEFLANNESINEVSKEKLFQKVEKSIIMKPRLEEKKIEKQPLVIHPNSQSDKPDLINLINKMNKPDKNNNSENETINTSKLDSYAMNKIENENKKAIEILSVKPLNLLKTNLLKTLIINSLNDKNYTKSENMETKKSIHKNQQLSVALIPQMNQMNRISSPVNLGVGGFYKVGLSKKIALVTGLQIGKQTLNQHFEQPMFSVTTAGSFQPKSSSTDWWSIEIPAQVSWKLPYKINQAEVSILTGISLAGTTQKVVESTFENTRTIITREVNIATGQTIETFQTKIEEITQQNTQYKQNFNAGVLLNFSINFSYPLGKNWLSVEPYIKNPITNMAGEEFRFLNSGVILKWNFGKSKINL